MKLNKVLTNSYIFIVVFVLFTILYVIYQVFKVNRDGRLSKYNKLLPFPTIKMENLPNPEFTFKQDTENCTDHIVPCNDDMSCTEKCGADYTCTKVEEGQEIMYNNIKVGEGNWCLPKNTGNSCGKYTGRAVWSADQQGQGWKCECLYPGIFDGPQCLNNKACKDNSASVKEVEQSNNLLVNSRGEIYDPNMPNFTPPGGISNPYALDVDGNPVYSCRCGTGSGNKEFVNLQNDPYSCHIEPCTQTGTSPLWNRVNQTCICPIDSLKNKDGTCVFSECPYGSWNGITQECECDGKTQRIRCNSTVSDWNDSRNLVMCTDPDNPVGIECIPRCITNICESDNPNDCGGKNGYRIEHCPDGKCAYCINGICDIDSDSGELCCKCAPGEMYNSKLGGCSGQGRSAGRGCFMQTATNARFFWVMEYKADSGCRYQVSPILYSAFLCDKDGGIIDPFSRIDETKNVCQSTKTLPGWRAVLKQDGNGAFDQNNRNAKYIQIKFDYAENKCAERCLYTREDDDTDGGGAATIAQRVEKMLNCMDVIGDKSAGKYYNQAVGDYFENLKDSWDENFFKNNRDILKDFADDYKKYYYDGKDSDGNVNVSYSLDIYQPWEGKYEKIYAMGLICDGPFDMYSDTCLANVFYPPTDNSCETGQRVSGGPRLDC